MDVKILRRWPGSVEILLEDFERMESLITAQAAEIERLRECLRMVRPYVYGIEVIQARDYDELREHYDRAREALISIWQASKRTAKC